MSERPTISITQVANGWHIEAGPWKTPYGEIVAGVFTADLKVCLCDRKSKSYLKSSPCVNGYHVEHMERFLRGLAATYSPRAEVPAIPFEVEKFDPEYVKLFDRSPWGVKS